MAGLFLLCVVTVALSAPPSQSSPILLSPTTDDYMHEAFLDQHGKYKVYWKFDDVKITFEVHVETTGYVGFGFSPNGGMPGSDIVIGWVKTNGRKHFTDRHALDFGEPRIDEKQDYKLLYGGQRDGITIFKFERKLDTCDDGNDWLISGSTVKLIWAYHSEKPEENQPLPWHGRENRGARSVYLLHSVGYNFPRLEDMQGEIKSLEILNDNVRVPHHQSTTYTCKGFQMPKLDRKHHIVMYEPVIQPGNEALVHHFIMYACSGTFNESLYHHQSFECFDANMPPDLDSCVTTVMGWAVGGGPMYFPEKAGMPIGGDSDLTFVMMETHYDNPEYLDTFVDSSGLRIHYTATLRQHDVTMLTLGSLVSPTMIVPPKARKFTVTSHCSSDCSQRMSNASNTAEVHVFGSLLHTHLAGRAIRVHHIRNGVELPVLSQDEHYDFNYQEFRHLKEEVLIRPGDSFVVECDYETMDRETITFGGFGTNEEMCMAFLYVYPRTNLVTCQTVLLPQSIAPSVGVEEIEHRSPYGFEDFVIKRPESLANISFFEYLEHVNWTNEVTRTGLEMAYKQGLTFEYCNAPLEVQQGGNDTEDEEDEEFFGHVYFPPATFERLPVPDRLCEESVERDPDDVVRAGCSTLYCQKIAMLWGIILAISTWF